MIPAITAYLKGEVPEIKNFDSARAEQETIRALIQTCVVLRRRLKTCTDPDHKIRLNTRLNRYERKILAFMRKNGCTVDLSPKQ